MYKMKLFYGGFLGVIIVLLLCIYFSKNAADSHISTFFTRYDIIENDVVYKTANLSLDKSNMILYHVMARPFLINHSIEKAVVAQENNALHMQLSGVHINVIESLNAIYKNNAFDVLKNYNPSSDALIKPLQSLAMMGVDELDVDINLYIKTNPTHTQITGQIMAPTLGDIDFNLSVNRENKMSFHKGILYALYGHLNEITYVFTDKGAAKLYNFYLSSLIGHSIEKLPEHTKIKGNISPNLPLMHLYK